jgi:hypothetical protein
MTPDGLHNDAKSPADSLPPISEFSGPREKAGDAPAPLPEFIGPYRVLGLLGAGGMGVVYRARQEHPSREVAVKVMRPGVLGPDHLHRFEREADVLGRFQHPGIARIYDAGRMGAGPGAQHYLVMEVIEGQPLTTFAADRQLSLRDRLRLMIRVCQAVMHTHQKGVIHGDLKPANILVNAEGQPKILDFGLSHALENDSAAGADAGSRRLAGTLPYLSPEHVAGDSTTADTLSDVYALGVVLYELLSGRRPRNLQRRAGLSDLRDAAAAEPPPLGNLDRRCRGDLEAVAAKALARNRTERYQSVAELADDLERTLRDEPVAARRGGSLYRLRKFVRRNRAAVVPASVLLLALLASGPVATWALVQRSRAEFARERADLAEAERSRLEADGCLQRARLASRKGHWREALIEYERALATDHYRNAPGVRLGMVRARLALNDRDRAAAEIESLAAAAGLGDETGSILLTQAETLLGRDDARLDELVSQALTAGLPEAERAYAACYRAVATPEAIEALRRAVALDSYQQRARLDLICLLILSARLEEAASELNAHAVLFPEDVEAGMLRALVFALERRTAQVEDELAALARRLPDRDASALRALTRFLEQFRNPAHRAHPLLGVPMLANPWYKLRRELNALGLATNATAWADVLAPVMAVTPFSRLPPRLRAGFRQVLGALESVNSIWLPRNLPAATAEVTAAARFHPEGTILYMRSLCLFGAERWREADELARQAAEAPALLPARRPALFVAAASESMLAAALMELPGPAYAAALADAMLGTAAPGPFAALSEAERSRREKNAQALLHQAINNLREMLTLGPHRPLRPDLAVGLALAAREYSLSRQLLDDWQKEAGDFEEASLLYFRAMTEFDAGANGPALKAADLYLRLRPKDPTMLRLRDQAASRLREELRELAPAPIKH